MRENGDSSISLRSSSNNQILENNVSQNYWYGISLTEASNRNEISKTMPATTKTLAPMWIALGRTPSGATWQWITLKAFTSDSTATTTSWMAIWFQITEKDCIWQIIAAITLCKNNTAHRETDTAYLSVLLRGLELSCSKTISSITVLTPTTWARATAGGQRQPAGTTTAI